MKEEVPDITLGVREDASVKEGLAWDPDGRNLRGKERREFLGRRKSVWEHNKYKKL